MTYAQALEAARAAVQQKPNSVDANLLLASRLVLSGAKEEALPYAETAVRLAPHDARALQALGDLYARLRRFYDAMQVYRKMLKREPDNTVAINRLGSLYISFGWSKEACDLLQPAVRAHPHHAHMKIGLALAHMQTHEYESSEKLLQAVRDEYPDRPDLWLPLADLYVKRGNYDKAIAVLRDGLRYQPDTQLMLQRVWRRRSSTAETSPTRPLRWHLTAGALAPDSFTGGAQSSRTHLPEARQGGRCDSGVGHPGSFG